MDPQKTVTNEAPQDDGYEYEDEEFEEDPESGFEAVDEEPEDEGPTHRLPDSQHAEHLELVDGRRLRPSIQLWLLFALAGALALGAVVLWVGAREPVWSALAGGVAVLIFLLALFTSIGVRSACKNAYFDFQRTVEAPERMEVGDTFTATLDATGCRLPGGANVRIRETPNPGLTPLESTKLQTAGTLTYTVRTNQRGPQRMRGIDVLITDRLGLWVQERRYALESEVKVEPGPEGLGMRAQIMGQMAFQDGTPKALIHIFRDVESEHMHDYGPGDRMKDVDWKLYGRTGQMVVREKNVESSTHAYLLFDCGTSMMMPRRGRRGIDIALEMANEIIANATDRTIATGYFAFNDTQAIDALAPTKKRQLKYEMPAKLNYITDPIRRTETKDPGRKLLQEQPLEASFTRSLKKSLGPKTSILVFTDLDTISDKIVQIIAKVAQGGAKVGIVLLPHPTYAMKKRFRRAGGKAPNGFRGKKVRKEMREVLMAQDVEFLDLRYKFDLIEEEEQKAEQEAAAKAARATGARPAA